MDRAGAPRWRWSVVTLAAWYAAALLGPVLIGVVVLGPDFLALGPHGNEPFRPCAQPMACGRFVPDGWQLLQFLLPFLVVSLVFSVPLLRLFVRLRWAAPLAGSLAAVLAWLACLAAVCVLVQSVRLLRI